jgi:DNA-binding XRE family transcriptional regulator
MPQHNMPSAKREWDTVILNSKPRVVQEKKPIDNGNFTKDKKLDNATDAEKKELLPRNISVQLAAARIAYAPKISQKELANQLNLPIKTIQEIESHKYKNDMNIAQRIARHLKCKLTK